MSGFDICSGLPDRARTVIIGEKYAGRLEAPLKRIGIEVIPLPDNPYIDERLSGHADMSVFRLEGKVLCCAAYLRGSSFAAGLKEMGYELIFAGFKQGRTYPQDACLNACAIGDTVIYSPGVTDETLISPFAKKIGVKQGYCNCSICAVNEKSIITSDRGIARALGEKGFGVLLITPGYIELEGFPCGFIGGCSFMTGYGRLALTGRLDTHPDEEKILSCLAQNGVEPVFLTDGEAFDIGSAVTLF